MGRILAIARKELIHIRRDSTTLIITFLIPCVQLLLLGFAIQTEVKHISTVVFDQSLSPESREIIDTFVATGFFDINYSASSYDQVTYMIDSGEARVGIIFPPGFSADMKRQDGAEVQVLVDASDSLVSNQAVAIANAIGLLKSRQILAQKLGGQTSLPLDIETRPWYNPDGITAYYMIPGLLGVILTMTMVIMTSIAIVRERERGTLEQLMVTPVTSLELMLGKIIPYIVMGYLQITVALIVGVLIFDIPIRGSLIELYVLTVVFVTASLGMGLMISTIAQNQMQAFQMAFFVMLPSIIMSGFIFPRAAMPQIIYWISCLIPITYYLDIIRGIVLKGIGIEFLTGQVITLLMFSLFFLLVSTLRFRKKIA